MSEQKQAGYRARFSALKLQSLMMFAAFVFIAILFTQTDGLGTGYSMIESISFTTDGRIVVAKLNGRDARTPLKHYLANIARTVSWIDASKGNSLGVIHQDFEAGSCGPAFNFWRVGRTSILTNPSTDHVDILTFGGGNVTRSIDTGTPTVVTVKQPAGSIACSRSGRYLAASGLEEVTVFDTHNNSDDVLINAYGDFFVGASVMSFSDEESEIVVGGISGVHVWHILSGIKVSTIHTGSEQFVNDLCVAPDQTVVVCTTRWVRRFDFSGQITGVLSESPAELCSVSRDRNLIATTGDKGLEVYDLTENTLLKSIPIHNATALEFSPRGKPLDCRQRVERGGSQRKRLRFFARGRPLSFVGELFVWFVHLHFLPTCGRTLSSPSLKFRP